MRIVSVGRCTARKLLPGNSVSGSAVCIWEVLQTTALAYDWVDIEIRRDPLSRRSIKRHG